jgi:hypothetical protein
MVSDDTDWSSGASGIACEAEVAAKLRPIANADAARIFMDVPFCWQAVCWQAVELRESNYANIVASDGLTTDDGASADAIPSDADDASGANPNGGGANAFDASPNAGGHANDAPSALARA